MIGNWRYIGHLSERKRCESYGLLWLYHGIAESIPVQAFLFFKQFDGCVHRPIRRVIVKLGSEFLHLQ